MTDPMVRDTPIVQADNMRRAMHTAWKEAETAHGEYRRLTVEAADLAWEMVIPPVSATSTEDAAKRAAYYTRVADLREQAIDACHRWLNASENAVIAGREWITIVEEDL